MLYRGDFIKYRTSSSGIGLIKQIFTYRSIPSAKPRLFIYINLVATTGYKDPVLELYLYKLIGKKIIVGLLGLNTKKIWIVPVSLDTDKTFSAIGRVNTEDLATSDKIIYVD